MLGRGSRAVVLLLVAAISLGPVAGCGDDEPSPRERGQLSSAEFATARSAQDSIRSYCRQVGRYLTRRGGPPTQTATDDVRAAVERLISLAREKPAASYEQLVTMRELIGVIAEDLEGTNCSQELVRRLEEGQRTVPSP